MAQWVRALAAAQWPELDPMVGGENQPLQVVLWPPLSLLGKHCPPINNTHYDAFRGSQDINPTKTRGEFALSCLSSSGLSGTTGLALTFHADDSKLEVLPHGARVEQEAPSTQP